MHERTQITVTGANDKRRNIFPFEGELDRIDRHLDVCGVFTTATHLLGDVGEFDLMTGEHATVFVEVRPVRVGLSHNDASPLGKSVGNVGKIEGHTQVLASTNSKVLVVEIDGDPRLMVLFHTRALHG